METAPGRRAALTMMGLGIAAGAAGLAALHGGVAGAAEASLLPAGATSLEQLAARLSRTPRRRDFKTVPMILNDPDQWDHAALSAVIAYRGAPKQVWDNTDIASPWLNLMRNALNSQVWSFRHPDFLVVSATHGSAHLALFEPAMWEAPCPSSPTRYGCDTSNYEVRDLIHAPCLDRHAVIDPTPSRQDARLTRRLVEAVQFGGPPNS
jgi:hypothetical protein